MANLWEERDKILNDHCMSSLIDFVKWNNGISVALLIFSSSLINNNTVLFLRILLALIYILLFISIFAGIQFVSMALDMEKHKLVYNFAKDKLKDQITDSEREIIKTQINIFDQKHNEWQNKIYRWYFNMSLAQMVSFLLVLILGVIKIFTI